jgi:hypothetical protein
MLLADLWNDAELTPFDDTHLKPSARQMAETASISYWGRAE